MLVLTRKQKQSLMLGDNIEVQVLEINGEQVRLGITAPATVRILRKELHTDISTQNQQAAVDAETKQKAARLTKKIKKDI